MQFTLTIKLGNEYAHPALEIAELLGNVHNELRANGITPGPHDINTRSYWRQSADGQSSELVAHTVGSWEGTEDTPASGWPANSGMIDSRESESFELAPTTSVIDVAQWYAMLAESDRQTMVRPYGCVSYGTANSFATLSENGRKAVTRAYEAFFKPMQR